MASVNPTSLPAIDEVEIVDLDGLGVGLGFVTEAAEAPSVRVLGADAQRIAELWQSLPPGKQYRCHTPPFGLRFRSGGEVVAQASICWKCNNIFGEAGGASLFREFDGEHEISRQLLSLLENAIGHPAEE
jgi:hypothetical protein